MKHEKEYLGKVVGETVKGFGELCYLIKLADSGKTVWLPKSLMNDYLITYDKKEVEVYK